MKYIYLILGLFFLSIPSIQAQTLEKMSLNQGTKSTILPSGEYISFSIGEGFTGAFEFTNGFVSVGAKKANPGFTSSQINLAGKIYPNPSSDLLWFTYQGSAEVENLQIRLINMMGHELWLTRKNGSELQSDLKIPVNHLPAGMYWLQLRLGDETQNLRFMKL